MTDVKEIGQVEKETDEVTSIEWKITNFFSAAEKLSIKYYESPTFSVAGASLGLRLRPFSVHNPGFMILLLGDENYRKFKVRYNFGLKRLDGSIEHLGSGILKGGNAWSDPFYLITQSEIRERKSELVPSDVMTITCAMKIDTISTSQSDKPKLMELDTLSENFKDLFDNKVSCDITLCVKDKKFKAHKAVLIARSPVFAAMFLQETSEDLTDVINIPDSDPEIFEKFLEYLYCGKVQELTYCSALKLCETSDVYNVKELKTVCEKYVAQCMTLENFCDIVIFADKNGEKELFSVAQNFFSNNVRKILITSEWKLLLKNNCLLANKLLIDMSEVKLAD